DRCNLQPGFHCGAGNGFSRVGAVHRRADPDRYLLHYCRSAGEAAMTSPLPIMPVVLWTDALVFLLVAVILVFGWHVRRHEHLLAPWRKVAHSRSGMVAAVVLAAFVAVGLLDSMHFRSRLADGIAGGRASYSVEMLSVFDVVATHLRNRPEKTYSAPLATH